MNISVMSNTITVYLFIQFWKECKECRKCKKCKGLAECKEYKQ